MKSTILFASLLQVATSNPDGFTVSASNLQSISKGFAVAFAATQNSHGTDGLKSVINYAKKNAGTVDAFGGWYDSETGLFYWDAVRILSTKEEAEKFARDNKQLAYFDLNTCTEIRCA